MKSVPVPAGKQLALPAASPSASVPPEDPLDDDPEEPPEEPPDDEPLDPPPDPPDPPFDDPPLPPPDEPLAPPLPDPLGPPWLPRSVDGPDDEPPQPARNTETRPGTIRARNFIASNVSQRLFCLPFVISLSRAGMGAVTRKNEATLRDAGGTAPGPWIDPDAVAFFRRSQSGVQIQLTSQSINPSVQADEPNVRHPSWADCPADSETDCASVHEPPGAPGNETVH